MSAFFTGECTDLDKKMPVGNLATGLAWSHFLGYLSIILTGNLVLKAKLFMYGEVKNTVKKEEIDINIYFFILKINIFLELSPLILLYFSLAFQFA